MSTERASADAQPAPKIAATLQAVLRFADGEMESVPVPVPLPSVVVHLRREADTGATRETWLRRDRSSDSVVRYLEEEIVTGRAPRSCSRCGTSHGYYFVPKLSREEPLDTYAQAYCERCYAEQKG